VSSSTPVVDGIADVRRAVAADRRRGRSGWLGGCCWPSSLWQGVGVAGGGGGE
jgi:hypothetical protein